MYPETLGYMDVMSFPEASLIEGHEVLDLRRLFHSGAFISGTAAIIAAMPVFAAAEPMPVEYFDIELTTESIRMGLTGSIEAKETVEAGFRQGGRIAEVLVNEGEVVFKAAPLARIDDLQQQQQLNVARAAHRAALAQQETARQAANRADALLQRGIGTKAAADRAAESLASAETALEQAITKTGIAERALEDTILKAPFDGVLTRRSADPGQIVGPAQPVVSVARTDRLEAVFQTPDDPRLEQLAGAKAQLYPIDEPDLILQGKIIEISPLVGPQTGSVTVRADIDSPDDGQSRLGAAIRGEVSLPSSSVIALPWTSLTQDQGETAVWVVGADDRVSLRRVTVSHYETGRFMIETGVEIGETVVAAGAQLMYPDRQVTRAGPAKPVTP